METIDFSNTWTPLFKSLCGSSVWGMKPHIKIVWITMLALKDKNGFVSFSVSGLARQAVVSIDECREALNVFLSPDDDSKNKAFEGRKIEEVDGGWKVLSHARHQELMHKISTRANGAARARKFRQKLKTKMHPGSAAEQLTIKNDGEFSDSEGGLK